MYIALVLSQQMMNAEYAYDSFSREVYYYTKIKPDLIVTHCKGSHPKVYCLPFHPHNLVDLIFIVIKLYSVLISRIKKVEGIIIWGSLLGVYLLPFRILGKKFIIVQLGNWPSVIYWKIYYNFGYRIANYAKIFFGFLEKIVFILSQIIITNSPEVVKKYRMRKIKFTISPLNISINKMSNSSLNKRDLCLVCISRLDFEKGILRLLRAYIKSYRINKKICDLYIIGSGPLSKYIEDISLKIKKIKFMGFIERKLLLDNIYKRTFALVIPSHTEGFPLVLLEAKFSGVPIIIASSELDSTLLRFINKKFGSDKELESLLACITNLYNIYNKLE